MNHKQLQQQQQDNNPKKGSKNATGRTIKLYINTFISNRTHTIQGRGAVTSGLYNRNGFMEVLEGGFKSTGTETLEANLPLDIDLSIRQNQGFSVYFWFLIHKPPPAKDKTMTFFIFKKGNTVDQFTPSVGFMVKDSKKSDGINVTSLFIQLNTSKSKKEMLFCNKKIEYDHLYSFAVTFNINYEEEATEASVYLDGKLDTQTTIAGEPMHNQGNVYFGRPDETSLGFKGTIADVIIVPRILQDTEIRSIFELGIENLNNTKGTHLYTKEIFNELFERHKLIEKYSAYTGKPVYAVENLNLSNNRMKEVVKNYDIEEKKNDIKIPEEKVDHKEERMINQMSYFLRNEDNDIIVTKIMDNARFINTVLYIANKGEDNMEVERIVKIFHVLAETLQFNVDEEFLVALGKNLNVIITQKIEVKGKPEKMYYINVKKFFKNLKLSIQTLEDLQRQEDEENAKYETKKTSKSKNTQPSIKSFYNSRKDKRAQTEPNTSPCKTVSSGQQYTPLFTDCIPEHERLLHKSQNMKNTIDEPAQDTIENFQSAFVLKSIYEKPKNLPGENPECPQAKIIESSLDESNMKQNAEDDMDENEPDPELVEYTHNYVDDIFNVAIMNSLVNVDIVKNEASAEAIQKSIYDNREKEKKDKEEREKKRREEEAKKREAEEREIVTETKIEEKNDYDPVIPENWSEGNFEVVINHCFNCHEHETTTKHYEYYFIDKFNQIGEEITNVFPNCVVMGNLDKPEYLGNFDVYLRGTGLPGDEKGRYYIYRKIDNLKFPSATDILDRLVAMAIMYGNTMNIESAQMELIKNEMKRPEIAHEHPASLSEKGEKRKQALINSKKKEAPIDPDHTKFACSHWGCNEIYVQNENKKNSCIYHSGLWQFGSYNRSWPACWTCCERPWDAQGCKDGPHEGERLDKRVRLCLNHSEPNPNTGRPDWACGKYFADKSDNGCLTHPGYIAKGKWTCCGGEKKRAGCQEQKHTSDPYPNEKAQLNFYPKYIFNPGLRFTKEADDLKIDRGTLITHSDYFKDAKIYPNIKEIAKEKETKENKERTMKRYCFNWACEKTYIEEEEEKKKKSCECHPGKWDHGSTGNTMVKFISEMNSMSNDLKVNKILWKPHWSCCRQDWTIKGCTKCNHNGPLEQDLPKYNKKYTWPDERMKLMFPKIVGERWKAFLQQFMYDEGKVRNICKKFFLGSKKIDYGEIPKLCDQLRLYLIIVQENPEWTMKFYDVVYQKESVKMFVGADNMADMEKFIEWWFMSYEKIYEINHPPKKEESPKQPQPQEDSKTSK